MEFDTEVANRLNRPTASGCSTLPGAFFILMTYPEQLKDSNWNNKRTEILMRDNFHCTQCGVNSNHNLEVHHLDYIKGMHLLSFCIKMDESKLFTLTILNSLRNA